MNIGQVLIGLAGLALGARTIKRGVSELSAGLNPRGLSGHGAVERDPGERGSMGRRVRTVNRGKAGFSDVREVESLDERINAIRDRIRKGRVDPKVIAWARSQVTKRCPGKPGGWCVGEKDTTAEIHAIFHGMRRDVRYTSDVMGVDTYVHPRKTLEQKAGDCLPGDTLLLTPKGFMPIEAIREGDTIHDGREWVTVTKWWDKGELPVHSFNLNNRSVLRCTGEHKVFRVTRASGEHVEVLADDLRVDDLLLQPREFAAGQETLSEAHATIIGAFLAEGWWDESKGVFCLAGVVDGKGLREKVLSLLPSLSIDPEDVYQHPRYIAFRRDHSWLVQGLGVGAANKALPHLNFDRDTVANIVHAMEMGDGGWSTSGKNMVYSTTSKTLALQYRVMKRMLGFSASMKCMSAEEHGGAGTLPLWRVTVRDGHQKRPWAKIRQILREVEVRHVYDIETTSSRIYLPESDVIVHNCDDYSSLGCSALMSVGIPCRLKVIRTTDSQTWNHIYIQGGTPKGGPEKWITLDASVPVKPGWEVPASMVAASRTFEVAW